MLDILRNWKGSFDMESVGATIYMRWYIQFIRNLYFNYAESEDDRMAFSDNYHFTDAYQRIISSVLEQKEKSHFQLICQGAYPAYKGENYCANSIAMALLETRDFLSKHVSEKPDDWVYGKLHINEYPNMPWSRIAALKPLFHRSAPVPGNNNTPNVSKINERKNLDNAVLSSSASGNFKMVVQLGRSPEDDKSWFSIDAGQNGNLFQGNYFDMNRDHLDGKLKVMKWHPGVQADTEFATLTLRPKKTDPRSIKDQNSARTEL